MGPGLAYWSKWEIAALQHPTGANGKLQSLVRRQRLRCTGNRWAVGEVQPGAATTALYAVLLERRNLSFDAAPGAFFRAFRRYWRTATALWLPALALGAVWLAAAWLTAARGLLNNAFALLPLLVSGAVLAFVLQWTFPLLASGCRGIGPVLRKAFLLGLGELWRSALGLAVDCLPLVLLFLYARTFMTLMGFWVLLGYALIGLVKLLIMEPVLRRHTPLGKQSKKQKSARPLAGRFSHVFFQEPTMISRISSSV